MAMTKIRGNTQIMEGTLYNAQIAADAAIASSKLADGGRLFFKDGSVALTGDMDAGAKKISNLAAVTDANADTDAASVRYVKDRTATLSKPMNYKGLFDASAGQFPTEVQVGDTWRVNVAGTVDGRELQAGDMIIANKTKAGATAYGDWDKVDNTEQVTSVAGRMGDIVLTLTDVTDIVALASEVNMLTGITGNVQSQLNSKVDKASIDVDGTMSDPQATKVPSTGAVKTYIDNSVNNNTTQASLLAKLQFVWNEILTGSVDGSNVTFELANVPVANSVLLTLNGINLQAGAGNDYSLTGKIVTLAQAPLSGDKLISPQYVKAAV